MAPIRLSLSVFGLWGSRVHWTPHAVIPLTILQEMPLMSLFSLALCDGDGGSGCVVVVVYMCSDMWWSTIFTYFTARNLWVSVGDMSMGKIDHCAVPLSSTSIFVTGG